LQTTSKRRHCKVAQQNSISRTQQQIFWLDIEVHTSVLMDVLKCAGNLLHHRGNIGQRNPCILRITLPERSTRDIIHHEKGNITQHFNIPYGHNVGMIKPGNHLGITA
jgi:hypothetical protein